MHATVGITIFCLIIVGGSGRAETPSSDPRQLLDSLRRELLQVERELETGQSSERDALSDLDAAERQTALLEQLIRTQQGQARIATDSVMTLERELDLSEQHLAQLGVSLLDLEDDQAQLEQSLARVLLAERRLSAWTSLEFLLGSRSWRELLARRVVLARLQRTERRALSALGAAVDTLQEVESDVFQRTQELRAQRQALLIQQQRASGIEVSLQADVAALAARKTADKARLKRIRKDQKFLSARQLELRQAEDAIQELIARGARGEPLAGMPLVTQKGRLPWPCAGRLAQGFGLVKNRETETQTDNPGIDISTASGAEVSAVSDGRVSSITWLRGYGNVCILEHPGAFFTVYAKLGQIVVQSNDTIKAGAVLGYAGYDAAAEDHRVHFELWSGKEKKNPLEWLAPR